MTEDYLTYGHRIEQYIADTARLTWKHLDDGGDDLRGARTPWTSTTAPIRSSPRRTPVSASAATGTGAGPKDLDEIWGVTKAYATRVGSGPFPTELDDELGAAIREAGGEYGTTTGRAPRRLDRPRRPALRRGSTRSPTSPSRRSTCSWPRPLGVRTRYHSANGASFDHFPYHQSVLHHAGGEYEELPGWDEDITECRSEDELPQAARDYLAYISDFIGVPIALISVGPAASRSSGPRGADRACPARRWRNRRQARGAGVIAA